MFLHKIPSFVRYVYPSLVWHKHTSKKYIYLTFDDGPIPEVTEWVLDILAEYNARATFFCVGDNVSKHTFVFDRIVAEGHKVGNHTFNHLKGWKTDNEQYFQNVHQCAEQIKGAVTGRPLFRPPYGAIKPLQIRALKKDYDIIMWDVLSGDFERSVSKEKCLNKTLRHTESGSIVVFHDSVKTYEKLQYVLPQFLKHFSEKGYEFVTL